MAPYACSALAACGDCSHVAFRLSLPEEALAIFPGSGVATKRVSQVSEKQPSQTWKL